MKVLLLGSGGREHAIAWKLNQSENLEKLFVSPGNPGTAEIATNVELDLSDFDSIANFIKQKAIDILVVGPEAPLVEGITDYLSPKFPKLNIVGPSKEAAQLEGSKDYAKQFLKDFKIPTAAYETFRKENLNEADEFLASLKPPYVLKADGLAGGKGVVILQDLEEAKKELRSMIEDAKFGSASEKVVIEEFLDGIEMSVFVLTDGKNYKILPSAKDYKRIGEGDSGLNTGGMGAISPVPFANQSLLDKIEYKIIKPTIEGIAKRQLEYKGFVFIGLMIVDNEPYVIEYNIRMGDPETEVVMPRIKSDLLKHLSALHNGKLNEETIEFDEQAATTVMLVSKGYPEAYEKNKEMTGFDNLGDCIPFHAGTKESNGKLFTNGGRVIALTAYGENFKDALAKSYRNADRILFEGKYFRKDIGFDLM